VKCNKSTEEVTFLTSGNVLHLRRLVGGAVDGGAEGGGLRVRVRVRVWGSGVSMTTNRWVCVWAEWRAALPSDLEG
jgi:hypothetical protein